MRVSTLSFAALLFAVGCGGTDSHPKLDGGVKEDMTTTPTEDLATAKYGCFGFNSCIGDCLQSGSSASLTTCETQCAPAAKNGSVKTLWETAFSCGEEYCTNFEDLGTAVCVPNENTGKLEDAPSVASGECLKCLTATRLPLLDGSGTCMDGTYKDGCTLCLTPINACLSNTP